MSERDSDEGSNGSGEEEEVEMEGMGEEGQDVDMEEVEKKITQAKEKIALDPTDYDTSIELLKLLRQNGDLEELSEWREKVVARFPLPQEEWMAWIEDAKNMEGSREEIEALFRRALQDISSPAIWTEFVLWGCGEVETARDKFEDAITALGFRVDVGGQMWEAFLDFEEAMYMEGDEKQFKRLVSLYGRAMRVPTLSLTTLRERYEELAHGNVDQSIIDSFKSSMKTLSELEKWEQKLEESEYSIDVFSEYLEWEKKGNDPARVTSFFERILEKHSMDENVWFEYTTYLTNNLKIPSLTLSVYRRAVRFCPSSCALWQSLLLAMEKANHSVSDIEALWPNAKMNIATEEDGRALYRTYTFVVKRRLDVEGIKDYSKVAAILDEGAEVLESYFGKHWDHNAEYRRMQAFFYFDKMKNPTKGRLIWEDILASGGGRLAERWLEATTLERFYGTVAHTRSLFYKAINSVSDHPQNLFTAFIQFEREEGDIDQLDKALAKVNSQRTRRAEIAPKKEKETGKGAGKKGHEKPSTAKQTPPKGGDRGKKRTIEGEGGKEKEEAPFPPKKPRVEKKVDEEGFAIPSLPPAAPKPSASKPSSTPSPVSADGKKDGKDGEHKWTIFVSNLDFRATTEQIVEVLDGVVEVRFPFRGMSKLHKGYGYVDMVNEEAFNAALAKDRTPIKGRPMYISRYQEKDDGLKKSTFKYGVGLEKSKLFVRNVHFDATNEQLKELFSQFGPVKDTRIVTHKSGQPKGVAYVDMEKAEDAEAAVNAKDLVLLERKLEVLLSNPPQKRPQPFVASSHPTPAGGRIGHSSKIDFLPRNVATKKSDNGTATSGEVVSTGEKKGNDFFRNLVNSAKK